MNRYRIAVLIFLIGASLANFFVAKQIDDSITAAVASIPGTGTAFIATRFGTFGVAEAHSRVRYAAWICEAILVTACGVAWFFIPKSATT